MSLLAQHDLNALRSLFLIYREKSVTKAARVAGVAQPSMSRTLARLREQFDDRLFLNQQGKLVATAKTEQLMQQLQPLFQQLDSLLDQHLPLEPENAIGKFHFSAPDFISKFAMASLPTGILDLTPQVEFRYHYWPENIEQKLQSGEIDLAFGFLEQLPNHVQKQRIASDQLAIFYRQQHPIENVNQQWNNFAFIDLQQSGLELGQLDRMLMARGIRRKKSVITADIAAAFLLLEKTDYLLIAPQKLGQFLSNCASQPLPFTTNAIEYCLYWGAIKSRDPLHQYIRNAISETFQRMFPQLEVDITSEL